MNDLIEMQSQIRKFFLSSKKLRTPEKYIGVELKKIGGLSNVNYIAVVKDMSTNGKIAKVLFRKFGALSEGANHELEKEITNYLAKKGMGPKFLYEEPNGKYRIVEFLDNTITIPRTQGLDPKILNKLFPIINAYSLISYTYKYTIKGDNINFTPIKDGIKDKRLTISKNQYEVCVKEWFSKAIKTYKIFTDQFRQKVSKEKEPKEWADMELAQYYFDNFKSEFDKNFPLEGFLVLSHNDTHRLNFLLRKKDQKLFILDHEYAYLNLPGNDMANYLNETFFNYEPDYYCTLDKIDFDKTYQIYLQFIEQFNQGHKFMENEEGGKEFLKKMKTKNILLNFII